MVWNDSVIAAYNFVEPETLRVTGIVDERSKDNKKNDQNRYYCDDQSFDPQTFRTA